MIAISSQTIDASPHQKMGVDLPPRAKQFVDVALPIVDVNATPRSGVAREL
jgi:hypothetical protein